MNPEKRNQPRFTPQHILAQLAIVPPNALSPITCDGTVEDLCYGGIRIRLDQPLPRGLDEAQVRIAITLPKSGLSLSINGVIKYAVQSGTVGMQFADPNQGEAELDDFMFECVKYCAA